MDFSFSDEQRQLRDALRIYLKRYPAAAGRPGFDDPGHVERWRSMAEELGVASLAVPPECGGLGGNPVDTMIVMEEFGAALVVEPFIETVVIAGRMLAESMRDPVNGDLESIANGTHRYALAHFETGGRVMTRAHHDGDRWRLTGLKSMALAAPWADRLVVSAIDQDLPDTAGQVLLFVVDTQTPGVVMQRYATVDGRCAADVRFDEVRLDDAALLHTGEKASTRLEEALDAARAAQAAEAIGLMRRMLQDTVEHTLARRQFGKALADFQVSRHRMTDMAIQIEMATSALYLGTLQLRASAVDRARAISTMAVVVARALRFVGQSAIQLHGGMGMTDELALGHYAKRALAIEQSYGSPEWHVQRFAALRDAA